jgi:type III secretory pathway component EscR
MTPDEIVAYVEKVKQQNRDRVTKYYKNTIKTDPEKYKVWLQKCKEANKRQYYQKNEHQMESVMEQHIESTLIGYFS